MSTCGDLATSVGAEDSSSDEGGRVVDAYGEPELHLFVIWLNGRNQQDRILADIQDRFVVRRVCEVGWDPQRFLSNLSRFYGKPLRARHMRRYGNGPFLLITVTDPAPRYEWRQTWHQGPAIVNVNLFDSKEKFRTWTDGLNRVHATNTEAETRRDLMLLLEEEIETHLDNNPHSWDGRIERIDRDPPGSRGWKTGRQLFRVLNASVRYLVLRNFDCLPEQLYPDNHGDVDLLTDDYHALIYFTGARPLTGHVPRWGGRFKVSVGGEDVLFDFRFVGDRYLDPKWAKEMLDRRVRDERGFFRPADDDHFYGLAYHALMQKPRIAKDYQIRLVQIARQLRLPAWTASAVSDPSRVKVLLDVQLARAGYGYAVPRDRAVFFNFRPLGSRIPYLRWRIRGVQLRVERRLEPLFLALVRAVRTVRRMASRRWLVDRYRGMVTAAGALGPRIRGCE